MAFFYIATSLSRWGEHNIVRDHLVNRGHTITYDWTVCTNTPISSTSSLSKLARKEVQGVSEADFVLVLLPGGFGTHVELGMALGFDKKVILHSVDPSLFTKTQGTCAFYHHPKVFKLICELNDANAFLSVVKEIAL